MDQRLEMLGELETLRTSKLLKVALKIIMLTMFSVGGKQAWAIDVGGVSPTGIEDIERIRVKCITGGYEEVSYEDLRNNKVCENKTFVSFCHQRFSDSHSDVQRQQINHTVKVLKEYVNSDDCQEAYKRLRNLTFIAIQNQQVVDLSPFTGLNKLRHLDLSHNHISDLSPLVQLKDLMILSVNANLITELKLLDMPRLRRLYISGNPLTSLTGLRGMFNLRRLVINNVGIADYAGINSLEGLQHAEYLEHLEVVGVKLQDASAVEPMRLLRHLNLSANALTAMPIIPSKYLRELDLSANQISDLEFLATNRSLRRINFSDNQIKDLSVLDSLPYLVAVDFSDNTISDLSPLASAYDLAAINFQNNEVDDLTALAHLHQLMMTGEEFSGNPIEASKSADNCPLYSVSDDLRTYCGT
ncbi:MAG: hypothetical protein OYH77_08695 [Pseudomonadota bacterium]|nr:hypothetical protein [Pseudomonadota bacterium]